MANLPSSTASLYSVDELITKDCTTKMMILKEQMESSLQDLHGRALSTLLMLPFMKIPHKETGKLDFVDMHHCVLDSFEAGRASQDQRRELDRDISVLAYTLAQSL